MGGVDLSDQYVAEHPTPAKSSRRWYFPIVGYLIDLAVSNSYLLYRRDCKLLQKNGTDIEFKTAKDFRIDVSKSLRCQESHERITINQHFVRPKHLIKSPTYRPANEVRYDGENHWPIFSDSFNRCKNCTKGKTSMICSKCRLNLCCKSDRNCFLEFHTRKPQNVTP